MIMYIIVALLLSIPYWYLAGGAPLGEGDNPLGFLIGMALPFIVVSLYVIKGISREAFWIGVIWLILPILCNFISILVARVGFENTSVIIFNFRYTSLIFIPTTAIFVLGIIKLIENVIRKFRLVLFV